MQRNSGYIMYITRSVSDLTNKDEMKTITNYIFQYLLYNANYFHIKIFRFHTNIESSS